MVGSGGRFDLPEVSWTSISSFKREIAGLTSGSFALALTANSHPWMCLGPGVCACLFWSFSFHNHRTTTTATAKRTDLEAIQNLPLLLSADNDNALAISLGEAIWGSICGAAHS